MRPSWALLSVLTHAFFSDGVMVSLVSWSSLQSCSSSVSLRLKMEADVGMIGMIGAAVDSVDMWLFLWFLWFVVSGLPFIGQLKLKTF